jgi:hypothetical protein
MWQRYTPSILNHPLQTMLNYGVHVALSCDDPQIFGNMGFVSSSFSLTLSLCTPSSLSSPDCLARRDALDPDPSARSFISVVG